MGDRLWRVVGGSRPPEPSSAGVLPNILLNQTRYCIKHYENHLPERLALHIATRESASASPSNHEGHGGAATGGALFATKFGRVDDHGDSRHGRPLAAFE